MEQKLILQTPKQLYLRLIKIIEIKRNIQKITQKELCENAGISLKTYTNLLNGSDISSIKLLSIMSVLEMDDTLEGLVKDIEPQDMDQLQTLKKLSNKIKIGSNRRVQKSQL